MSRSSGDFSKTIKKIAASAKVLDHPARIGILNLLSSDNKCLASGEIVAPLPLSRSSVLQHLTALKESGWVKGTLNGSQVNYCLDIKKIQTDVAYLSEFVTGLTSLPTVECNSENVEHILFLCTGNSCRSQIAEAFLNHYGKEFGLHGESAGVDPATRINPFVEKVMKEKGISIEGQYPKDVKEYLGKKIVDMVIFVCDDAEKNCPYIFPFTRKTIKMPFFDPASFKGTDAKKLAVFRKVRDEIEVKIKAIVEEYKAQKELGND